MSSWHFPSSSSSDMISIGSSALSDLHTLSSESDDLWNSLGTDDGVVIQSRKSNNPIVKADILRCKITLNGTNLATVLALVSPWLPYRTQWDDNLLKATVLHEQDGHLLIHHITKKKNPLSARDSIDVVTLEKDSDSVMMSSRSIPSVEFPLVNDTVRTYQNLGAYHFRANPDGSIDFMMYLHCDLKISAPLLIRKLIEKAVPRFMCSKLHNLRKACSNIDVAPEHLQYVLPTPQPSV